tara:strand:- start:429 stop:836 length:408 start_codon:yes stop_codon:yes gene_type:complete
MADKKISELTSHSSPASEDLLVVIDDPNGTPVSKQITLKNLFGAVPANTVLNRTTVNANTTLNGTTTTITANLDSTGVTTLNQLVVANNQIRITTRDTVGANTATGTTGQIRFDTDYIYVCVDTNTWKRVALSQF